jgi:DNA replication protein DnaC
VTDFIDELVQQSLFQSTKEAGDYVQDGLLMCGKCGTKKQTHVPLFGQDRLVGCSCKCQEAAWQAKRAAEKRHKQSIRIQRLRSQGVQDSSLSKASFATSDMNDESMKKCKRFADNWEEMLRANTGLLLWGNTGNGKTHAAACIFNQLIDRGIPCLMTSFPRILNCGFDKQTIVNEIKEYDLVIIDDLGAERQSEYALETVYLIVDERYKTGKPLIVTTNLELGELKKPQNMTYQRIYDRVLEMCVPVAFKGESWRKQIARSKLDAARDFLNGA